MGDRIAGSEVVLYADDTWDLKYEWCLIVLKLHTGHGDYFGMRLRPISYIEQPAENDRDDHMDYKCHSLSQTQWSPRIVGEWSPFGLWLETTIPVLCGLFVAKTITQHHFHFLGGRRSIVVIETLWLWFTLPWHISFVTQHLKLSHQQNLTDAYFK